MVKNDALKLYHQFEALCAKYNLWFTVEMEKKPELKMIRIKEISIKVDEAKA